MPSRDDDSNSDAETEAAMRRAVRAELRAAVRVLGQISAGLLLGFLALPAIAGALLILGAPLPVVVVGSVIALLALGAYGWRLPPFR